MMTKTNPQALTDEIGRLKLIVAGLRNASDDGDKLEILNQVPQVDAFVKASHTLQVYLAGLSPACDVAIKSILAIGQGPIVFQQVDGDDAAFEKLRGLIGLLLPVEQFYQPLGGIVGYHLMVLTLIAEKQGLLVCQEPSTLYRKPVGLDLSAPSVQVDEALRQGIESLGEMAEIYPVGGAGDRFQLRDEETGDLLPMAQFRFCGITLLEWLVRDVQAREYLHYKLTGKQTITPIAMMTSHEKSNHARILLQCERGGWFGRPKGSFRFFTQPLVPMISDTGDWCLDKPLKLMMKPGGHGVMWKLACDQGIFKWFQGQGRNYVLVRQINNPIAGVDLGLLAFTGYGLKRRKAFGFASCFRAVNSAEGVNVLLEKQTKGGYACSITNIEYTDFAHKGIEDSPVEPGSGYSAFPSNTNILFADLQAIGKAAGICPVPGLILNMKNAVDCLDAAGQTHQVRAGRLESTMQNIADEITDFFPYPPTEPEQAQLGTYITYNQRQRTISVTKKCHVPGGPILETPEGCFFDIQSNMHGLLAQRCGIKMPPLTGTSAYVEGDLPFIVHLHPALGPLFDVVAAKIRGGTMEKGAELVVDASEVDVQNLHLAGSLLIKADAPFGRRNPSGEITYGDDGGKCTLKNVRVENKGLGATKGQCWWKAEGLCREECLELIIHGNGEFNAEGVTFHGAHRIEVPDGYRVVAVMEGDALRLVKAKISQPTWAWKYAFDQNHKVILAARPG